MTVATTLALVVAVLIISGLVYIVLRLLSKQQQEPDSTGALLQQEISRLSSDMGQLKDSLHTQLGERFDKNQAMMLGSMQRQFSESTKIISEVTRNLTELKESNKQVLSITDDLKTLQNVLQNPKQRGVLGEFYLSQVLENVLPPDRFILQYAFKNGDIVDAVVKLDRGQLLPIDSKFSLENYNRFAEAADKLARDNYAKLFRYDLKQRIDETAKYVRPGEKTMDYAFMFIPSEAIYYDVLVNKVGTAGTGARDLIEYAYREKHVIIVSPTTFMAYLQTVLQGLRSLQIEGQAKEIQQRVGELGRHIATYETFMQKLGSSLGTSVNHFNAAHKELGKIDKDVIKIADTKPVIEPLTLNKPVQESG